MQALPVGVMIDQKNVDCMSQGAATLISASLGGFAGCGIIPPTNLNMKEGGRRSLSVWTYAGITAACVLFLGQAVGEIAVPSLAGVMIVVGFGTVQWKTSRDLFVDALRTKECGKCAGMVVSSLVCYRIDMASGIMLGVVAERVFGWLSDKMKKRNITLNT